MSVLHTPPELRRSSTDLNECWLCHKILTRTREHIIPESMGGKKTVHGFICRDCNSRTGHDWDVAVTNFESWKFHLQRDLLINPQQRRPIRGRMADPRLNVFVDSGGEVRFGFNPPTRTQKATGEVVYEFVCDPSRVDDLFESVNTLLQRRNMPPMTRDEFDTRLRYDSVTQPVVNFPLQLAMPKYYRSVAKTAMAMAFSLGINPMDCENAVRYLRDEEAGEDGVVTLPDTSLRGLADDWIRYHAVTIFGFPQARRLIGEVLYFGSVVGLVALSDSYSGPDIIAGHSIDLRTGQYADADFNLPSLHLPVDSVVELLKMRTRRFKSPMVLQAMRAQYGIGGQAQ